MQRFRPAAFPDIKKELASWITEKQQGGIGVSTNVICFKAKSVMQKLGIAEESSKHWCYGFMELNGFSKWRKTTIAKKLPQDYEEKLVKFQHFVIVQRKKHDFELKYIGNADQKPLTFDIVKNSTVSEKEVVSVWILTTGHEKDRFTVMLPCLRGGSKHPPYIVFEQKTLFQFHHSVSPVFPVTEWSAALQYGASRRILLSSVTFTCIMKYVTSLS